MKIEIDDDITVEIERETRGFDERLEEMKRQNTPAVREALAAELYGQRLYWWGMVPAPCVGTDMWEDAPVSEKTLNRRAADLFLGNRTPVDD